MAQHEMAMNPRLTFLGAAGTVTGSKYLIETDGRRLLLDCGLFQGFKQLRLRNWDPLPVAPASIDLVVLTHAHLDHSGYLPLLVRNGFKGPIYCTAATQELCGILLPDAGHLAEQDADFANRHGFSKHKPALPLFTEADARNALHQLRAVDWERLQDLGGGLSLRFRFAGHILGAATAELSWGERSILFTGDLGRPDDPVMRPPAPVTGADYLVVESTYGDRRHDTRDPQALLGNYIRRTVARGGSVLIPAFAIGRAQSLLYLIYKLKQARQIPDLPVYLDSPMAINASEIYENHRSDHRLSNAESRAICAVARETRSAEESKAIDASHLPSVIISASGMLEGGRVLHHLKAFGSDARNTLLFTGYQAPGTRGAAIQSGARQVKLHGAYLPIRAEIGSLATLSAHADAEEIIAWLKNFQRPPKRTYVTHGEPDSADALRRQIAETLNWDCCVPAYRDSVTLD
jgi:metallo-beta-lactamase family protein